LDSRQPVALRLGLAILPAVDGGERDAQRPRKFHLRKPKSNSYSLDFVSVQYQKCSVTINNVKPLYVGRYATPNMAYSLAFMSIF
jgi:hypothetical protein